MTADKRSHPTFRRLDPHQHLVQDTRSCFEPNPLIDEASTPSAKAKYVSGVVDARPAHRSDHPPRSRRQRSKAASNPAASSRDGPSISTSALPAGGKPSG